MSEREPKQPDPIQAQAPVDDATARAASKRELDRSLVRAGTRRSDGPTDSDLDSVRMYLSKIGCVDLLSREQEVEIAMRIEAARLRWFSVCSDNLGFERLLHESILMFWPFKGRRPLTMIRRW